jgi:hypothetical protein
MDIIGLLIGLALLIIGIIITPGIPDLEIAGTAIILGSLNSKR